MAEPFGRPSKEDLKKALRLYSDPILYWATNKAVEALQRMNPDDFDIKENQANQWIWLTRRMIWNYGWLQISMWVDKLAEEDAETYWANWTPPKEAETKSKKKFIGVSKEWKSG